MEVEAAVSQSLPVSVLLGTDTTQLGQLLQTNPLALTSGLEQALVKSRRDGRQRRKSSSKHKRSVVEYILDRLQMTLLPRFNLRNWGGNRV